jgi:hypothetical protein
MSLFLCHKRIRLIPPYVAPKGIMAIKYETLLMKELNQYCNMLKGKNDTHKRRTNMQYVQQEKWQSPG